MRPADMHLAGSLPAGFLPEGSLPDGGIRMLPAEAGRAVDYAAKMANS